MDEDPRGSLLLQVAVLKWVRVIKIPRGSLLRQVVVLNMEIPRGSLLLQVEVLKMISLEVEGSINTTVLLPCKISKNFCGSDFSVFSNR